MGVGGIAVDGAGNAFLAGYISNFAGAPFPAKNAFQSVNAGGPFEVLPGGTAQGGVDLRAAPRAERKGQGQGQRRTGTRA